jgi:cytochrome c553
MRRIVALLDCGAPNWRLTCPLGKIQKVGDQTLFTYVGIRMKSFAFAAQVLVVASLTSTSLWAADAVQGNAEAARSKTSMCIGCHGIPGYKASFPTVYSVPMISGQSPKYLENALMAYKKGERSHPTMRGIAASLSDQDMADLAAYYGGSALTAAAAATKK